MIRILRVILLSSIFFFSKDLFSQEEFNGPFISWADVKSRFGAKGDGRTDDTKAIQMAIDSLTVFPYNFNAGSNRYTVLYFPAGNYLISSTLNFRGKIGCSIIGEHPENTRIIWKGGDTDTMLLLNGSSYSKISRLTFDANLGDKIECVGLHWMEKWKNSTSSSYAPENTEFSDLIFTGKPMIGLGAGTVGGGGSKGTGHNDSEVAIKRCKFLECSKAGIKIEGYNVLDYWIWDSKFILCGIGVLNNSGNYHIYNSLFKRSSVADVHNRNSYYTSVRGCFSFESKAFSLDEGSSCNPFKRIFQDNVVVSPQSMPIEYYHVGKITLTNNLITKSLDTVHPFLVNQKSWCPADYSMLSVNNTYGYSKQPLRIANQNSRILSWNDQYIIKKLPRVDLYESRMADVPRHIKRKNYEIPSGADANKIQSIINIAARNQGSKPIVHFAAGLYNIDKSLIVPRNSDMQICGDGLLFASTIRGVKNVPFFIINGPTYVTIRDLEIGQFSSNVDSNTLILFQGCDQQEGKAFLDQLYSLSSNTIFLDHLDFLRVQKMNSFFADGDKVSGGARMLKGKGTSGLFGYGAQFAMAEVSNGGNIVAKDCWWEGSKRVPLKLSGNGNFTLDGMMLAPPKADSNPTIIIDGFKGNIALINGYVQGGISVKNSSDDLKLLVWNLSFYHQMNPNSTLIPLREGKLAFIGNSVQCFDSKSKECENPKTIADFSLNVNIANDFIPEMLKPDMNSRPLYYGANKRGVSNIFISRVSLGNSQTAIKFR